MKLNEDFMNLMPKPEVMCLGEELPMKVGKYEAVIVPPTSSNLDVSVSGGNKRQIGSFTLMTGTNHITVCKPKDEQ